MNITYVNNTDLTGRIFNGYDLHKTLNSMGHNCNQTVIEKSGNDDTVIPLISKNELFVRGMLKTLERELSINNLLYPYARDLKQNKYFKNSDIVHYHILHNQVVAIPDYPELFSLKKSVWTIHDPWLISGHCIYPIECMNWKNECDNCPKLMEEPFPMYKDNTKQMWHIKSDLYKKINADIVVSTDFMKNYIERSPLTSHFTKIHKIPFGIDLDKINIVNKREAKKLLGIPAEDFVIAFRNDLNKFKGSDYSIEAIDRLHSDRNITILTVGIGLSLEKLKQKYNCIELGWQNNNDLMNLFYCASDLFLMPSLAESFGLMAIEAMARKCPVVTFEQTVLTEITFSPECGVAVEYKNSRALSLAITKLINNSDERLYRGELGYKIVNEHYRYSDYVSKHIELYENILYNN
jgi:glycosyltransferase involved in cell wall biosynthesis